MDLETSSWEEKTQFNNIDYKSLLLMGLPQVKELYINSPKKCSWNTDNKLTIYQAGDQFGFPLGFR